VVAGNGASTMVVILDGEVEVAAWRVRGSVPPDLSVIDALARLHVVARRLGWTIALRCPSPQLRALLDLAGLVDVVPELPGSVLEPHRQAEGGKELGVEEVVPRGDPAV
jgi:hypothetical protein